MPWILCLLCIFYLIGTVNICFSISYYLFTGFKQESIGEMGINAIAALSKLKILVLYSLPFLNGFTNLRRLQQLDCHNSDIREEQIITVIQNSPELRYLDVSACCNTTENIFSEAKIISACRCNDVALELVVGYMMNERLIKQRCVIYNGEIY